MKSYLSRIFFFNYDAPLSALLKKGERGEKAYFYYLLDRNSSKLVNIPALHLALGVLLFHATASLCKAEWTEFSIRLFLLSHANEMCLDSTNSFPVDIWRRKCRRKIICLSFFLFFLTDASVSMLYPSMWFFSHMRMQQSRSDPRAASGRKWSQSQLFFATVMWFAKKQDKDEEDVSISQGAESLPVLRNSTALVSVSNSMCNSVYF